MLQQTTDKINGEDTNDEEGLVDININNNNNNNNDIIVHHHAQDGDYVTNNNKTSNTTMETHYITLVCVVATYMIVGITE